jgi:hypothetical protein
MSIALILEVISGLDQIGWKSHQAPETLPVMFHDFLDFTIRL